MLPYSIDSSAFIKHLLESLSCNGCAAPSPRKLILNSFLHVFVYHAVAAQPSRPCFNRAMLAGVAVSHACSTMPWTPTAISLVSWKIMLLRWPLHCLILFVLSFLKIRICLFPEWVNLREGGKSSIHFVGEFGPKFRGTVRILMLDVALITS